MQKSYLLKVKTQGQESLETVNILERNSLIKLLISQFLNFCLISYFGHCRVLAHLAPATGRLTLRRRVKAALYQTLPSRVPGPGSPLTVTGVRISVRHFQETGFFQGSQ